MGKLPTIILEGADSVGKTTAAKELIRLYGYRYHHEGPPESNEDSLTKYCALLEEATTANTPVVFDRLVHSHIVYDSILRGRPFTVVERAREILSEFESCGGIVVLLSPPMDEAEKIWEAIRRGRHELLGSAAEWRETYVKFLQLDTYQPYTIIQDAWGLPQRLITMIEFMKGA